MSGNKPRTLKETLEALKEKPLEQREARRSTKAKEKGVP